MYHSNSIIKKQWLNNIINFENVDLFYVTQAPNNDIIFIFFRESESYRSFYFFFYELKSSGEQQYLSETMYYEFGCEYLSALFVTINNKHYPLICCQEKCLLLDLENNYYKDIDYKELIIENSIGGCSSRYLFVNMINLDNKNKILFTHINEKLILSINNIINLEFSFDNINKAVQNPIIRTTNCFILKCFVTNNNYI